MKKALTSTLFFVLLAVVAVGQVHRDTDDTSTTGFSIDFTSLAIGLVVGAVIGYLIGARAKKA